MGAFAFSIGFLFFFFVPSPVFRSMSVYGLIFDAIPLYLIGILSIAWFYMGWLFVRACLLKNWWMASFYGVSFLVCNVLAHPLFLLYLKIICWDGCEVRWM